MIFTNYCVWTAVISDSSSFNISSWQFFASFFKKNVANVFLRRKKIVDECDYRLYLAWQIEFTIMYEKHLIFQIKELKAALLFAFSVVPLGFLVSISFSLLRTKDVSCPFASKNFRNVQTVKIQNYKKS